MYDDIIKVASETYKIDPDLIRAIISVESGWNPKAYRAEPQIKDASYGLMQVLHGTGKTVSNNPSLTTAQLYQPTVNILIGTKYLKQLSDRYNYYLDDVIAGYNAGSAIKKLGFYINQGYITKVKMWLFFYKKQTYIIIGVMAIIGGAYWYFKKRK